MDPVSGSGSDITIGSLPGAAGVSWVGFLLLFGEGLARKRERRLGFRDRRRWTALSTNSDWSETSDCGFGTETERVEVEAEAGANGPDIG